MTSMATVWAAVLAGRQIAVGCREKMLGRVAAVGSTLTTYAYAAPPTGARSDLKIGYAVAALAGCALIAGCTADTTHRSAPTDTVMPAPADSGGVVRTQLPEAHIDMCTAMSPSTLLEVLGQSFASGTSGTAGGTLLGECDYTATMSPSSRTTPGSLATVPTPTPTPTPVGTRRTGTAKSGTAQPAAPTASAPSFPSISHVYVAARAGSQYVQMVKSYGLTPTKVAGQLGAYGPSVGLVLHVPFGAYVLQIAVTDASGQLLSDAADAVADWYVTH